jgi:hypothetical protein
VFRIFPLKLRFDFWIMLAPEIRQILRDLNRFHARRQNVNCHRNFAERNFRRLVHVVKFLNPQRNERRFADFITHFWRPAIRQRQFFRRVLAQKFALRLRKLRHDNCFHFSMMNIYRNGTIGLMAMWMTGKLEPCSLQ